MKKKSLIITALILIMCVGYATIASTIYLFGNVSVTTSGLDVIFVSSFLNGVDVSDITIEEDKTKLSFTIDNLTYPKKTDELEFYMKNKSNQYDADVSITCAPYTLDSTKTEENAANYNKYLNINIDKDKYEVKALKTEKGLLSIKLKEQVDNETSITFRCTLIADAKEKDSLETSEGFAPGEKAYLMGLLGQNTDSTFKFLENTNDNQMVSHELLDELSSLMASKQAEYTPVGNILSVMSNHAPAHYLICDGTVYNIEDYPFLAEHFEKEFGSKNYFGGNGTTTFAVPNLQGEFLRGYSKGSSFSKSSGVTTSQIGKNQQPTEIPAFGFTYPANSTGSANIWTQIGGTKDNQYVQTFKNGDSKINMDDSVKTQKTQFFISSSSYTANGIGIISYTMRPTNTSVLYVIKYEPTYYMVIKN